MHSTSADIESLARDYHWIDDGARGLVIGTCLGLLLWSAIGWALWTFLV